MNSMERFQKRLRGETVDHPPNFDIMMTFAAHYIRQPLSRYYQDYRVLCDANYTIVDAFNLDILQAISDPYREAADLGAQIDFPHDGLPVCIIPLLQEEQDLAKIIPIKPENGRRMTDRLHAITRFREQAGDTIPVMGWVEGALAEAADLRGVSVLMMDLYERPEWVKELLELCVLVGIDFARAQVKAGANIIGLGDSVVSQISPELYREFALPYQQRIFAAVKELGAIPRLHICGNTSLILNEMAQSGADIIDLDWMVNFGRAASQYGGTPAICGNFDPVAVMLQGTTHDVRTATFQCMQQGGTSCISMAGCEIPDGTPVENLLAQAQALHDFGVGNY